jgi:hypothetical protein
MGRGDLAELFMKRDDFLMKYAGLTHADYTACVTDLLTM